MDLIEHFYTGRPVEDLGLVPTRAAEAGFSTLFPCFGLERFRELAMSRVKEKLRKYYEEIDGFIVVEKTNNVDD
jgi:hypothetical protein